MKLKIILSIFLVIFFMGCEGSGGGDDTPDAELPTPIPAEGKIKGTFSIDLSEYINDGYVYGDCGTWFIDVVMTGSEECIDNADVAWNLSGVSIAWGLGYTQYFEYTCTLAPGIYAVELKTDEGYDTVNQCKNPDGSIVWYTFDTLIGSIEVKENETTQVLPVTIQPYQVP